jgi:Arc/MetJ-type ribon-helix-helix transcriptional regulator
MMTVDLPGDVERFIQAEIRRGSFASEEAVLAEGVRLLQKQLASTRKPAAAADPVLGAMRDAADELDEIVFDAMSQRDRRPWRLSP